VSARAPVTRAATVRTTVLSNHRQTLAVPGYLKDDASAFERPSLVRFALELILGQKVLGALEKRA